MRLQSYRARKKVLGGLQCVAGREDAQCDHRVRCPMLGQPTEYTGFRSNTQFGMAIAVIPSNSLDAEMMANVLISGSVPRLPDIPSFLTC